MPIITSGFSEFLDDGLKELTNKLPWMKNHTMKLCESLEELAAFVDGAIASGRCALDTETTGLNTRMRRVKNNRFPMDTWEPGAKLVALCLCYESKLGLYVPVGHQESPEQNLLLEPVLDQIRRLCSQCVTIYHHAKYDLAILKNYDVIIDRSEMIEDTDILSRMYDAGTKFTGLKPTADKILGRKMLELEDVCPGTKRLDMVSPKLAATYGASDAICTLDLYLFFMGQEIVKNQMDIYKLEKRIVFVVLEMESNYIKIDLEYLQDVKKKALQRMDDIVREVYRLVGREFNVSSTQQLGKVLFKELGYTYPDKKMTDKGFFKTDTPTLEKIANQYPVVESLIEYRSIEKLIGTYVNNLLSNHDEEGCVKVNLKQTGTDTGRFSMPGGDGIDIDGYSGVPFHGLPKNKAKKLPDHIPDIRKSVIARSGYKIVAMDYSGEELRVTTNLSREPKWLEAFLNDMDIHAATAKAIYNKNEVTTDERGNGKTVNFLVLYGGGPQGLAQQAHISEGEARRMLDAFFKGMPVLKRWIDVETVKARKQKFARTAFGRIRPLHMFYDTGDRGSMAHADRCAVNHVVQGSSADIMKLAMVLLSRYIHVNGLHDEIHMLLTVHDEIVFEIKEDKLDTHIPILDSIMRLGSILQGPKLAWPVPLKVKAEYGDTWHVTNNYFEEHPGAHLKEPYVFPAQAAAPEIPTAPTASAGIAATSNPIPESKEQPADAVVLPADAAEPVPADPDPIPAPVEQPIAESKEPDAISQDSGPSSQGVSQFGADSEFFHKNDLTTPRSVIYTIYDRRKGTLRKLNDILNFLDEEDRKGVGKSPKERVTIRDNEGNLVSEVKVRPEVFVAFSRYFGV